MLNKKERGMEMDYRNEMVAFRTFLLTNRLSTGAISLWYTLFGVVREQDGKRELALSNALLGQITGLSRQGILDARKVLASHGLLNCQKGTRSQAPIYMLLSIASAEKYPMPDQVDTAQDVKVDTALDTTTDTKKDTALDTTTDTKQDTALDITVDTVPENRPDTAMNSPIDVTHDTALDTNADITVYKERRKEEEAAAVFEKNIATLTSYTKTALQNWVNYFSSPVVLEAIRITVTYNGRTFRYVEKILQEWQQKGLQALPDILAYEKDKRTRPGNIPLHQRLHRKNKKAGLFDALREEYCQ